MLPVELLQHIFTYIGEPQCIDTVNYQSPNVQRYQFEHATGRKDLETKAALLLVSKGFYAIARQTAWSWISVFSKERLHYIDSMLSRTEGGPWRGDGTRPLTECRSDRKASFMAYFIRRIEVQLSLAFEEYADTSPIIQALARILSKCSNLEVYVSDISVATVDCQRTSPIIISALKGLPNLRRLDFAVHESPSIGDYIELIPQLDKLEQLVTGRIADSEMEEEELMKAIHLQDQDHLGGDPKEGETGKAISLPALRALQLSRRPVYSCLRLFIHIQLPSLTHISIRNVDFHGLRTKPLFRRFGRQLTHLYTNDIRTSESPFGYARLLSLCPNLQHITFSPRLRDGRHEEPWVHAKLRTVYLRSVLPSSVPNQVELVDNIARAFTTFSERMIQGRLAGTLPSLHSVRIEDEGIIPSQLQKKYGTAWDDIYQQGGVRLEDNEGRRIPWQVPETITIPDDAEPKKPKIIEFMKRIMNGL